MKICIIGLGSMGYNLTRNLISKGFSVWAYEKNINTVRNDSEIDLKGLTLKSSMQDLCSEYADKQLVLLSIPSHSVDQCIDGLANLLSPGDIVADLGNSLYSSSVLRSDFLAKRKIEFLGIGVSGGPRGAHLGPAIMAGGSIRAWNETKHIFEAMAAKRNTTIACQYFGLPGNGHFIKAVHNGIEYALMAILAEICNVLMAGFGLDRDSCAQRLAKILNSSTSSFLLDLTSQAVCMKGTDNKYLLDSVDHQIGHNGTGQWTINAAMDLGVSVPSIYSALSTRLLSNNFNFKRMSDVKAQKQTKKLTNVDDLDIEEIVFFNFACGLFQGLHLIEEYKKELSADFGISAVFKAWSAGCILQGKYLDFISSEFESYLSIDFFFLERILNKKCTKNRESVRKFIAIANSMAIPTPTLSATMGYHDQIYSTHKLGEITQLQRHLFGGHPIKKYS
jgi:6-phosphogluconate dehydrogenase